MAEETRSNYTLAAPADEHPARPASRGKLTKTTTYHDVTGSPLCQSTSLYLPLEAIDSFISVSTLREHCDDSHRVDPVRHCHRPGGQPRRRLPLLAQIVASDVANQCDRVRGLRRLNRQDRSEEV